MKKAILIFALILIVVVALTAPVQVSAAQSYTDYVNIPSFGSGLNIEPSVIVEPTEMSEITQITATSRPTSVIVAPDAEMNITLGDQTMSFTELFDTYLKGKCIAAVRLDAGTVETFVDYITNEYTISDIIVVSDSLEVLEKIHKNEATAIANSVYDLTDLQIPSDRYDLWQYIGSANEVYCNTLMFDGADENLAIAADYISAMSKVCWAKTSGKTQAAGAIAAGCYGVVSDKAEYVKQALQLFSEKGFARAQQLAAHRGITDYCNENSLTAIAAAASEGATHIEVDIQICKDGKILLCHDELANNVTDSSGRYFAGQNSSAMRALTLNDYSDLYDETFPTLEEVIDVVSQTDIIMIIELKLGDADANIVNKLKAIKKFNEIMQAHPEMNGHWFTITFFKPFADEMQRVNPQISVGYLGGATSKLESSEGVSGWNGEHKAMSDISGKIAFMHKYSTLLDEEYGGATDSTCANYLARGYVQNTWTFNDTSHFNGKINIATSNVVEKCAMAVKKIIPETLEITQSELDLGKITVQTQNYNGWVQNRECEIIVVEQNGNQVQAVLYCVDNTTGTEYGLYSQLFTFTLK